MASSAYHQMRRWNKRHPRGGKSQYCGFSTLGENERRKRPRFGGWQFDPDKQEELQEALRLYNEETERLLKINPNLKLVD